MIETNHYIAKPLKSLELKQHLDNPELFAINSGYIPSTSVMNEETRKAILNDLLPYIDNPDNDPIFYTMWLIIEKYTRAIVGGFCFHGEPDPNGNIEIGYGIDDIHRNKGIMTEVINGIIQWLISKERIKSIIAETNKDNIPSIKVLQKKWLYYRQGN